MIYYNNIKFPKVNIKSSCEMKYSETDYVVDAKFDKDRKRKISDLIKKTETRYAIHSTLVTAYGVSENAYSGEIQSIITAEDLFAE